MSAPAPTSSPPAAGSRGRQLWLMGASRPIYAALVIIVLLMAAWALAFVVGGSRTAAPHAFYLPIVLAAVLLRASGGATAGLAAALLAGPLLPEDSATWVMQSTTNWLLRGLFFVLIGTVVGLLVDMLRGAYEAALEERFAQELRLARAPEVTTTAYHDWQVRDLLDRHHFQAVFQPIYALSDGRLLAVEALTRFSIDPPETPDVWFARATELGLGRDLEIAVMEVAVSIADREGLPAHVALSLNCSPDTLADPRLVEMLASTQRPIVFEITEHAIVEDYHDLDAAMAELRTHGATFAVDDAGAGFASLRHIVRLAPEVIKLDMSLTQNLRHDPVRRKLADCLIRFAHGTGIQLYAEGIEHHADLTTWRELGANGAQGFHLGRPGPLPVPMHCRVVLEEVAAAPRATHHLP
ncbi:MAG TPA: EAL domain-containing protein [Egicoccus sp.]|nr:EAL domain-containing protein [Egicoccus sp.]HSK21979.1 EAL domain-containing protein [Egicoccus sp.]